MNFDTEGQMATQPRKPLKYKAFNYLNHDRQVIGSSPMIREMMAMTPDVSLFD